MRINLILESRELGGEPDIKAVPAIKKSAKIPFLINLLMILEKLP